MIKNIKYLNLQGLSDKIIQARMLNEALKDPGLYFRAGKHYQLTFNNHKRIDPIYNATEYDLTLEINECDEYKIDYYIQSKESLLYTSLNEDTNTFKRIKTAFKYVFSKKYRSNLNKLQSKRTKID